MPDNQVPLEISVGALPTNYSAANLQDLFNAFAERLTIIFPDGVATFQTGSTPPSSNEGPFFLYTPDGYKLLAWSDADGQYAPLVVDPASLRYIISPSAPDPNDYDIWYEYSTTLYQVISVRTYNTDAGAWRSIYYTNSEMDSKFSGTSGGKYLVDFDNVTDTTNKITTAMLQGLSVTDAKIANVNGTKIYDGTVTDSKIVAISGGKLTNNSIPSSKIISLDGSKIADSSILGSVKLVASSITESLIQSNAVSTDKIRDLAVTLAKIATGAFATPDIIKSNTGSTIVTSDGLKYHPALPKAWARCVAGPSPSLSNGYNVVSVTRISTGRYRIAFHLPMDSANFGVQCTPYNATPITMSAEEVSRTSSTVEVAFLLPYPAAGPADPDGFTLTVYGALA